VVSLNAPLWWGGHNNSGQTVDDEVSEGPALKCQACNARCVLLADAQPLLLRLLQSTVVVSLEARQRSLKDGVRTTNAILDLCTDALRQPAPTEVKVARTRLPSVGFRS